MATIAVIGTLDSKGHEHAFVAQEIRKAGHEPLLVDVGTLGAPRPNPTRAATTSWRPPASSSPPPKTAVSGSE